MNGTAEKIKNLNRNCTAKWPILPTRLGNGTVNNDRAPSVVSFALTNGSCEVVNRFQYVFFTAVVVVVEVFPPKVRVLVLGFRQ